ncbi:MAG: AAA family ATPase [Candidatus Methanomethylophilus sp.]|nr:AAA family ATPase [Methanomethylophilus sp.]MBQ5397783.1 AAA family ATPase [Methanomethylophilus sp.]
MEKISNNLLLYGPPGTGKTYNVVNYAVAIIENRPLEDVIADGYGGNLVKYDKYTKMGRIAFMTFHQSLSYDDFIEGIRPEVTEDGELIYTPTPGAFYKFCVSSENPQKTDSPTDVGNCVFIIDEINRGNISRIFGELITLLESSRRKGMDECLEVFLAQMKVKFSVPANVYVLGTMNTADKSLTALDAALRRRFEFVEMMPDPDVLKGRRIMEVDLSKLLATINNRIELLYDREHMLGHAYFIPVKTIDDLAQCMINKIIPQLQDYFFDDYEKMCWVLGKAADPRQCKFIKLRKRNRFQMNFNLPDVYDIETDYNVFLNPQNYIDIYKGAD